MLLDQTAPQYIRMLAALFGTRGGTWWLPTRNAAGRRWSRRKNKFRRVLIEGVLPRAAARRDFQVDVSSARATSSFRRPRKMERKADENHPLRGTKILIAEDEILIALDLEAAFRDAGAEVVGPFMTLSGALNAAESEPVSIAILDIRLGTATTEAVSDLLTKRGIPFLFYSGQRLTPEMQRKCGDAVLIDKPAKQEDLVGAAVGILAA